jgi:hypothetical protein
MFLFDFISRVLSLMPLNQNSTNEWSPDPTWSTTLVFKESFVFFSIGVPFNLLVIYLSFFNKEIKHHCKYLLGNLAICDILFLSGIVMSNLMNEYLLAINLPWTPFVCTVYRTLFDTPIVCMLNAVPLISFNRYAVIVLQNDDIFTNKKIFLMCLLVYYPLLYPLLTLSFPMYLVSDAFCGYNYWFPFIREFLVVPIAILSIASVFCIVKTFLFLQKHMKTVSAVVERSKLKDERSILISITIQGLLPLVSCIPSLVLSSIGIVFHNYSAIMWESWHIFGVTIETPVLNITMTLLQLSPVFDAWLTLLCVRQYRRIIVGWPRKIFAKQNSNSLSQVYPS